MPFYERQPYIQPLHQIIGEVLRGDIRVPLFQRPGTENTWRPEQRGDFLDSLYRGFPVGTILLWSTTQPIKTYEEVGGIAIPEAQASPTAPLRLLLDGHQRISTLVQILGPALVPDLQAEGVGVRTGEPCEETWVFEVAPTPDVGSSRERFILLKPDEDPTPTQLPLDIIFNRAAVNRWVRSRPQPLSDNQQAEVDGLRDRLREYAIPVAVLVANSLKDATESFKRINSSGTPMGDFNMVSALAYDNSFDLQDLFKNYRASFLEPCGWDAVDSSDMLRVCAGLAGYNPARFQVDDLASELRRNESIIERAFSAAARAADYLSQWGIHGPEALPYSWQLITLAVSLGTRSYPMSSDCTVALGKWFWLTTYGEVFAGVNAAVFDRCRAALNTMIVSGDWKAMERDVARKVRAVHRFDFRAARSKACALAMARHQDENTVTGQAHKALSTGVHAMAMLMSRGARSHWWNLVVARPEEVQPFRNALKRRERDETAEFNDGKLLEQLGVPTDAKGSQEELLTARRKILEAEERAFVQNLGLEWSSGE